MNQKLLFFLAKSLLSPLTQDRKIAPLSSQAKYMASCKKIDLGPDEQELLRVTTQHKILKAGYSNKLIQAPINLSQPGLRILDSACADGKSNTIYFPNQNRRILLIKEIFQDSG